MRIIAGEFRGRRLLPPATDATRPITDRVKQSLFDILTPLLPDGVIYDCFAGTGSMGLESLSRGAGHATFFEADRSAVKRLEQNISTLKVEDRSTIIVGDIFRWFADPKTSGEATIVFLDPPYRYLEEQPDDLRRLCFALSDRHLRPEGTLVFRHAANSSLDLPPFRATRVEKYGNMVIELMSRSRLANPPPAH